MSVSVTMPALGESVSEGTVTRWLKKVGEQVQADEPLLEVSTDKVDTEIPAPASGVLTKIVVAEDETVDVGTELAVIGDSADEGGDNSADDSAGDAADEAVDAVEESAEPEPAAQPAEPATVEPTASSASQGGTAVTMPALGESVTEGTVTRWLKSVGDEIAVDEPLLEVSTDKVDTEIPSPVAGTLVEITVQEDETVEVGAQLAMIGATGAAPTPTEAPTEAPTKAPTAETTPAPTAQPAATSRTEDTPAAAPEPAAKPAPAPDAGAAAYVTPLVRKLAAQHGVDLATVTGTGVGGRIRKQDVVAAAAPAPEPEPVPAPQPAPAVTAGAAPVSGDVKPSAATSPRGSTEKLSRLRRVIATRMVESLQISAQLTTVVEVDITRVARLRARAKADFEKREGVKLSFLPFFALATVDALKAHPRVNSSVDMDAGTVTYHDSENLGIAVDTERGLLVPVIHDAGDLNLGGIARKIADLADRTRNNKITPDELAGGTFTLTNTGSRGALFDTPIINQPQSAILGTGTVVKRPVVMTDDELGEVVTIRSMVYLALSYDHRIIDGADAARFLVSMKERLESGDFESDLGLA